MSDLKTNKFENLLLDEDKLRTKKPKKYNVILLNDDFTPMDFVVYVLINFFRISEEKATSVMWTIHTRGRGIGGTYSREIAEMKVMQVNSYARKNKHPLISKLEVVKC